MSIPNTEARIAAQERLATVLNARIEEVVQNIDANFKDVKQDLTKIGEAFILSQRDITKIKDDIAEIKIIQSQHFETVEQMLRELLARTPQQPE